MDPLAIQSACSNRRNWPWMTAMLCSVFTDRSRYWTSGCSGYTMMHSRFVPCMETRHERLLLRSAVERREVFVRARKVQRFGT